MGTTPLGSPKVKRQENEWRIEDIDKYSHGALVMLIVNDDDEDHDDHQMEDHEDDETVKEITMTAMMMAIVGRAGALVKSKVVGSTPALTAT